MRHNSVVGGGPTGPDDDDYGPPDWFAAAEPEPEDEDYGPPDWFAAVAEPEPEDEDYGPPDWFAAVAEPVSASDLDAVPDPVREPGPKPGRARGRSGGAGGRDPLGDGAVELVPASELPTGRRRRRSALVEEATSGDRAGGGAAGHGGAAAPSSFTDPGADDRRTEPRAGRGAGARQTRTRARERAGGEGRTGARAVKAEESLDPEARARDICLRLLTGAAKTRKQLADALRKREIPDEVADEVLTRLEEVGLIDDAAFALAWVESRHAVRGLSRRALAQELRTKGVAGELVEQAVAQLDHDDESEAARALVERKLRATRGVDRQARTRRLVGVLARRGYSEGLAFRVVREALDAEAADDGPDGEDVDGGSASGWE
ncbi:regulatory protein RecX [Kitasatospora sp. NPDC059327]|uniref:regulatory protein RecX n=1 Tax=Kitasatospora sp. NPDC059327 TaxID=3346803 RepID=UPI00368B83EE